MRGSAAKEFLLSRVSVAQTGGSKRRESGVRSARGGSLCSAYKDATDGSLIQWRDTALDAIGIYYNSASFCSALRAQSMLRYRARGSPISPTQATRRFGVQGHSLTDPAPTALSGYIDRAKAHPRTAGSYF